MPSAAQLTDAVVHAMPLVVKVRLHGAFAPVNPRHQIRADAVA